MKTLILILLFSSVARADFFCDEESGQLSGNVYHACGLAESPDENTARQKAFIHANDEMRIYCLAASNCVNHHIYVNPKRTVCKEVVKGGETTYKCARLVEYTIKSMNGAAKWVVETERGHHD